MNQPRPFYQDEKEERSRHAILKNKARLAEIAQILTQPMCGVDRWGNLWRASTNSRMRLREEQLQLEAKIAEQEWALTVEPPAVEPPVESELLVWKQTARAFAFFVEEQYEQGKVPGAGSKQKAFEIMCARYVRKAGGHFTPASLRQNLRNKKDAETP
jgi:hypothetical protein